MPVGTEIIAERQFEYVRQKFYRPDVSAVTDLPQRAVLRFIKPVELILRKLPVMKLKLYVVVEKA